MTGGRLAAVRGSWRTALRIARREARRSRRRTLLVLVMIALPVFGLSFAAVSYDMADLNRAERIERQLGGADIALRWDSLTPVTQDAWGESAWPVEGDWVGRTRPATAEEVRALLPEGSRVARTGWWMTFSTRVNRHVESLDARALDLTDPLTRPLAEVLDGRPPVRPDEIAVSPTALRRLDTRIGDPVRTVDGATYRVVGVVEYPDNLRDVVTLAGVTRETAAGSDTWLVDLPGPLEPGLADRLNAQGIQVVVRDPLPGRQEFNRGMSVPDADEAGVVGVVGGLGLLEVVLLVGPAFAVSVRRRRRDLALVAVAGGDASHLRRIVLADGVVLGAGGAALGMLLGIGAAFAGRPIVEQYLLGERLGAYRIFPAALAAIAATAVLAGVLAAMAPAWAAARQDVATGLAGRRDATRPRRRWLLIGVALTAAGTAIAAFAAGRTSQTGVLAGVALGELGLVFCTPSLVGVLGRAGRLLPLTPRLALRDASRNRSSAAPAISAVMAAVAGSVALGVYVASDETRSRELWQPGLPPGNVLLTHSGETPADPPSAEVVAGRARAVLPDATVVSVATPGCVGDVRDKNDCTAYALVPPEQRCPYDAAGPVPDAARRDPRCVSPFQEPVDVYLPALVDDGGALAALTGAPDDELAAARRTLAAGGVVVTDARRVVDGQVRVEVNDNSGGPPTGRLLPAYALRGGLTVDRLVLSPVAADALGLTAVPMGYLLDTAGSPTDRQMEMLADELFDIGPMSAQLATADPPSDQRPMLLLLAVASGVITLGAAAVATGLAAAEGRRDLSTLAAVGADPRVRRLLSLCQAGVIAVLGSALGIVAGLGSAVVVLASLNQRYAESWPVQPPYPVTVPGVTLAVLVVVPMVAMGGAALFTRSRLPIERRLD
ncbi:MULTISPECIES: ABC transporter permease [Micromonospora]|uniref:ABC transporter permease n=1 Tax=Micromonospora TaxID=1873 RepID=UPI0021C970AA|nr:ABC transporter permease [Micromonospora sp. Mcm103]